MISANELISIKKGLLQRKLLQSFNQIRLYQVKISQEMTDIGRLLALPQHHETFQKIYNSIKVLKLRQRRLKFMTRFFSRRLFMDKHIQNSLQDQSGQLPHQLRNLLRIQWI